MTMQVAVCVITYLRPKGLARLLEGLSELTFERDPPGLRCVVVDNDPAGSARAVCDRIRPGFPWKLEYYIEPRRGIPQARNAAIAHAGREIDYLAYIDDDEVPDPKWLDELLRVIQAYDADVATGPVLPFFIEEPPVWVIKGEFFKTRRRPTGQELDRAFTGNIIFRYEVLKKMAVHFDERLALTGGSDLHFLRCVHRAGFKIVWADEAVATEWIPASRVGVKRIIRRGYRVGTSIAFARRDLHSLPVSTITLLILGGYRIVKSLLLLPIGLVWGRHKVVVLLRQIGVGVGMLAGSTGRLYHEYERTHGA